MAIAPLAMETTIITLLLVVAWVGVANAQLTYIAGDQIMPDWTGSASPVGPGNGAFTSPDGSIVVVTSKDGSAKAFDTTSGTEAWTFTPPSATATSTSGVFFSYSAANPYLCFSYVDSNMTYVSDFELPFLFFMNHTQLCKISFLVPLWL
jgi:outer membrane protein assembly factor BamB